MQITWRNGTMEGRFCDKLLQAARKPLILNGEMSEWLKEHAWKACVGETLPWVRIPLSPPSTAARREIHSELWWMATSTRQRRIVWRGARREIVHRDLKPASRCTSDQPLA